MAATRPGAYILDPACLPVAVLSHFMAVVRLAPRGSRSVPAQRCSQHEILLDGRIARNDSYGDFCPPVTAMSKFCAIARLTLRESKLVVCLPPLLDLLISGTGDGIKSRGTYMQNLHSK